jgi:YD repeat-containing protein
MRTTSATYTRAGKPETATDANSNTTRFAWDPLDRLTAATDPMGRTTRYATTGSADASVRDELTGRR